MALYRVQGNGKAPAGLQAGDEVVTGGGTYRILGVNADGSYRSSLSNKYQTIYNYRGSYGTAPAGQTDTAQVRTPGYTPSGAASEAKAALDRVLAEKPGSYTSRWDKELDSLYEQIANRKAFSYDLGADPMYRQYREQYQSAGRLAMENTMGAAAALTGGYGSSYSQQAGQQAYNAYLQKLNEVVPELYAQARDQYDREGTALSERYARISSREKSDYDRYRDQMSDYYAELSDARSAYQSEAQRSENLALQYAKLANDNYWNELNYRSDREDAANAQYWKQLAYADKQAAEAEKAAQAVCARGPGVGAALAALLCLWRYRPKGRGSAPARWQGPSARGHQAAGPTVQSRPKTSCTGGSPQKRRSADRPGSAVFFRGRHSWPVHRRRRQSRPDECRPLSAPAKGTAPPPAARCPLPAPGTAPQSPKAPRRSPAPLPEMRTAHSAYFVCSIRAGAAARLKTYRTPPPAFAKISSWFFLRRTYRRLATDLSRGQGAQWTPRPSSSRYVPFLS